MRSKTKERPEAQAVVRQQVIDTAVNAGLTVCKFLIGTATHCTALVADGFKDLAGAARSGLRLGLRRLHTDLREHRERPAAARRLEQTVSTAVFLAILYMGLQSVVGAVRDMLEQHDTNYTPALFIVTVVSIVVKGRMAYHKRKLGRQLGDHFMVESGLWAALDSAAAAAILATAIIDRTLHVDIDPWVALGVAALTVIFGILTLGRRLRERKDAGS